MRLREVLGLGPATVLAVVATVLLAFFDTLLLGRLVGVFRGHGLMVATGFSICGASAIGGVARTDKEDVATGVTLVTLHGSAAIALVPLVGTHLKRQVLIRVGG